MYLDMFSGLIFFYSSANEICASFKLSALRNGDIMAYTSTFRKATSVC